MFFNEKQVIFNTLCVHGTKEIASSMNALRKYGFEILNLRETDILDESGKKVAKAFVVKCRSKSKKEYEKFKKEEGLRDFIYEGLLTLV